MNTTLESCPIGFVLPVGLVDSGISCSENCITTSITDWHQLQVLSFILSVIGSLLMIFVIYLWLKDKERRKQYLVICFCGCSCGVSVTIAIASLLPLRGYFCSDSGVVNSLKFGSPPSACVFQAAILLYFAYCACVSWVIIGVDLFIKVVLNKPTKGNSRIYFGLIFILPLFPVLGGLQSEQYGFNRGLPWCGFSPAVSSHEIGDDFDIFIIPASAILFCGLFSMLAVILKIFRIQLNAPKTTSQFQRTMSARLDLTPDDDDNLEPLSYNSTQLYYRILVFIDRQQELFKPFRTPTTFILAVFIVWATIISSRIMYFSSTFKNELDKWTNCVISNHSTNGSFGDNLLHICGHSPRRYSKSFLCWLVICIAGQSIFISLIYLPNIKFDIFPTIKRLLKPAVMMYLSLVKSDKRTRKRLENLLSANEENANHSESSDDSSVTDSNPAHKQKQHVPLKPSPRVARSSVKLSSVVYHSNNGKDDDSYGSAPMSSSSSSSSSDSKRSNRSHRSDKNKIHTGDVELDFRNGFVMHKMTPVEGDEIPQIVSSDKSTSTTNNNVNSRDISEHLTTPQISPKTFSMNPFGFHTEKQPKTFFGGANNNNSVSFSANRKVFGARAYRHVGDPIVVVEGTGVLNNVPSSQLLEIGPTSGATAPAGPGEGPGPGAGPGAGIGVVFNGYSGAQTKLWTGLITNETLAMESKDLSGKFSGPGVGAMQVSSRGPSPKVGHKSFSFDESECGPVAVNALAIELSNNDMNSRFNFGPMPGARLKGRISRFQGSSRFAFDKSDSVTFNTTSTGTSIMTSTFRSTDTQSSAAFTPSKRIFSKAAGCRIVPETGSFDMVNKGIRFKKQPYSHFRPDVKWPAVNIKYKESAWTDQDIMKAVDDAFGLASSSPSPLVGGVGGVNASNTSSEVMVNHRRLSGGTNGGGGGGGTRISPLTSSKNVQYNFNFDVRSTDYYDIDIEAPRERGAMHRPTPPTEARRLSGEQFKSPPKLRSFRKVDNSTSANPGIVGLSTSTPGRYSLQTKSAAIAVKLPADDPSRNRRNSMLGRLEEAGKYLLRSFPHLPLERIDSLPVSGPNSLRSVHGGDV